MTVYDLHQVLAAPSAYEYPECLREWRTTSYRVCDDDDDGEHCECGKRIWHVFSVEHITGATIPCIGSKCIKQFDSEFATQAHGLELLVKRTKAAAKRAADAAHRAVATVEANRDALRVHQEARHKAAALQNAAALAALARARAKVDIPNTCVTAFFGGGGGPRPVAQTHAQLLARHRATAATLCTYRKHRGAPWADVMSSDPSYCGWLLTSGVAKGDLKEMFLFFRA